MQGSSSFISNDSGTEDHGQVGGSNCFVSNDSRTEDHGQGQGGGSNSFVSNDCHTEDHGQVGVADKLLCNICDFEPLRDPVVTSCGHLYCWPCLNQRLENQSQKQCPACASPSIHSANFVKIYGSDLQPHVEQMGLQCRICLEASPPTEAVATSCGHVFCWPCLYEWLHIHYRDQGPCPVCRNIVERDVNILPLLGKRKVHAGNDVSSNVDTVADVANSGGFIIPPRPSPPEDASALSSRKYSTCFPRFTLRATDEEFFDSDFEFEDEIESHDNERGSDEDDYTEDDEWDMDFEVTQREW